jgi:hypothetical protein
LEEALHNHWAAFEESNLMKMTRSVSNGASAGARILPRQSRSTPFTSATPTAFFCRFVFFLRQIADFYDFPLSGRLLQGGTGLIAQGGTHEPRPKMFTNV